MCQMNIFMYPVDPQFNTIHFKQMNIFTYPVDPQFNTIHFNS